MKELSEPLSHRFARTTKCIRLFSSRAFNAFFLILFTTYSCLFYCIAFRTFNVAPAAASFRRCRAA